MTAMLRPTGIVGWASAGVSTQPTVSKQALGWGATGSSGERPPAEYFNWLQQQNESWLRYLSYDRLIDDDFVGPVGYSGAAPDGWGYVGSQSGYYLSVIGSLNEILPMGGLVANSPSGWATLYKNVYAPGSRDFYLQVARSQDARQSPTGIRAAFGLMSDSPIPSPAGNTAAALFMTTGASGCPWRFVHGSTQTIFGIYPTLVTGSGLQIFNVERRGATLTASIRCPVGGYEEKSFIAQSVLATYAIIGTQRYGTVLTVDESYDYFKLGVRRPY